MMDREVIEKKIDIIEENLDYLEGIKSLEVDSFVSNFEKIQAAKHCLQEAIEACLDIAGHIIASRGFPRAEEYREFFFVLSEKKVIGKDLALRLADMAGFRNLLVHRYGVVRPEELYRIVNEDLGDIRQYVKEILVYVSEKT